VDVFVEIPKGSRNKYEYDETHKAIRFDRMLFSSLHYPCDYGFIPETLGDDGDALDALVVVWEPTFPGCLIQAMPVGVFEMSDEKGKDEKILCVPTRDPLWNHITELAALPPHLLKEIEHFFKVYKDLEDKKTEIRGWKGKKEAEELIREARKAFEKKGK
ncbi:MAG: inorganic diphosphatase, partial [Bdellovibrionales bacterium]|nr:inorganic diphosphatase [Bdellovibrionales bacterium]